MEPEELRNAFTEDLADELVRRLGRNASKGRFEIEFDPRTGRATGLWGHEFYSRSDLTRFDPRERAPV